MSRLGALHADGEECGRPPYLAAGGPCYLHAEGDKDSGVFAKEFDDYASSLPAGQPLDCTRFVFPAFKLSVPKGALDRPFHARKCRFQGLADFSSIRFRQSCHFQDVEFLAVASFTRARFRSEVGFWRCTFKTSASFTGITCKEEFTIQQSTLGVEDSFDEYRDSFDWSGAAFGGSVSFHDVTVVGRANFWAMLCSQPVKFEKTTFTSVDFQGSEFRSSLDLDTFTVGETVMLSGIMVRGLFTAQNTSFNGYTILDLAAFQKGWYFWKVRFGQEFIVRNAEIGGSISLQECDVHSNASWQAGLLMGRLRTPGTTVKGTLTFRGVGLSEGAQVDLQTAKVEGLLVLEDFWPFWPRAPSSDLESRGGGDSNPGARNPEGETSQARENETTLPPRSYVDSLSDERSMVKAWSAKTRRTCQKGKSITSLNWVDISKRLSPTAIRGALEEGPGVENPQVHVDLRNLHLGPEGLVRIQGANCPGDHQGRMDGSKILFAHTDVSRIRFENVRWDGEPAFKPATRSQVRVADEFYLTDGSGERTHSDFPPSDADKIAPPIVANIYKGLRRSYENNLHYSEAGPFHVREMEMRRFILEQEIQNTSRCERRSARWHLWWLDTYRLMSNYGESYGRALAWIGALIAVAGGLHLFDGWLDDGPLSDEMAAASKAMPDWLGRALVGLESAILNGTNALIPTQLGEVESLAGLLFGITGIFLAAQFGIALRRNFRR